MEAGAKTALMEVDEITLDYLRLHGREPKHSFKSDADACFAKVYDIDLSTIKPIVAKPHFVDSVVDAKECVGTHIDEAFLGSCNNGRKTLVGGELKSYTEMMNEARALATRRMVEEAEALGADAVVNVRFASAAVMAGAAEVMAYGTAVRFV